MKPGLYSSADEAWGSGHLASSSVATRSERVIGPLTVIDQKPAQIVRTAARFVDAADLPLAGNDGVIRPVLVDPGAEAGWAHGKRHSERRVGCKQTRRCRSERAVPYKSHAIRQRKAGPR